MADRHGRSKFLAILSLQPDATSTQIRSAYRRLAIQWHPDKNQSPEATARFQEISRAYTALTDADYQFDEEPTEQWNFDPNDMLRFMNLFQELFVHREFEGVSATSNFVFAPAPAMFFESDSDSDDLEQEPEPSLPQMRLSSIDSSSVTVEWSVDMADIDDTEIEPLIFRLEICCSSLPSLPWSLAYMGPCQEHQIFCLLPSKSYQLRLGVVDPCDLTIAEWCAFDSFTTQDDWRVKEPHLHPYIVPRNDVEPYRECAVGANYYTSSTCNRIDVDRASHTQQPSPIRAPRHFYLSDDDDSFEAIPAEMLEPEPVPTVVMVSDGEELSKTESTCSVDNEERHLYGQDTGLHGDYETEQWDAGAYTASNVQRLCSYLNDLNGMSAELENYERYTTPKSTELCKFFKRGICRFGSDCLFSHDPLHHAAFDYDDDDQVFRNAETDSSPDDDRDRHRPTHNRFPSGYNVAWPRSGSPGSIAPTTKYGTRGGSNRGRCNFQNWRVSHDIHKAKHEASRNERQPD